VSTFFTRQLRIIKVVRTLKSLVIWQPKTLLKVASEDYNVRELSKDQKPPSILFNHRRL